MSVLKVTGLGKSFGNRTIFKDIELDLCPGVYALTGKNGSGKSTLLKLLAGVIKPDRGTIVANGHDLATDADRAKICIGYMPDSEEFYDFVTPVALWQMVTLSRGVALDGSRGMASRLGLTAYVDQPLGSLSQGTRRKVFLAAAFLGRPPVILLDEPSNTLDVATHAELCQLVTLASPKSVVLISTHDVELVTSTEAQVLELTASGIAFRTEICCWDAKDATLNVEQ